MIATTVEVHGKYRIWKSFDGSFQVLEGCGKKTKSHGRFELIEKARECIEGFICA